MWSFVKTTWVMCALLIIFQDLRVRSDAFEREWLWYNYSPQTGSFFVISLNETTLNCFVFGLTENEKLAVHTDEGMRAIEVKCLGNLGAAIPVHSDDLDPRDLEVCHWQKHRTVYLYKV